MKKSTFTRTVAGFLTFVMILSTIATSTVVFAGPTRSSSNATQEDIVVLKWANKVAAPKVPQAGSAAIPGLNFAKSALMRVGGRLFNEFTAYCISNDVPVLGDTFYYVLCSPAQRSTMKTNSTVQEINKTVNEIEKDLDNALTSLAGIENAVNLMMDQNKADAAYKLIDQYSIMYLGEASTGGLWSLYTKAMEYTELAMESRGEYDGLNKQIEKETDEEKLADLKEQLAGVEKTMTKYEENAKVNMDNFIVKYQLTFLGSSEATVSIGSPVAYDSNVYYDHMSNMYTSSLDYLYYFERVMRGEYDFEHQITDIMSTKLQDLENLITQMFLIHKEYATYCAAVEYTKDNGAEAELPAADDLLDFNSESVYFEDVVYALTVNSGIANFMLYEKPTKENSDYYPEDYSYEKELSEGASAPSCLEVSVGIDGTNTSCYLVRDNKAVLNGESGYFVITQSAENGKTLVNKWENNADMPTYVPYDLFDSVYTDDGNFKLISSLTEMPALDDSTNPFTTLHSNQANNLSKLSQSTEYFILNSYSEDHNRSESWWNVTFANAKSYKASDAKDSETTISTKTMYQSGSGSFLRIYKSVFDDELFANDNSTYKVNDSGSMPKELALRGGEVLDYSAITVSASGYTFVITGAATIIGNPDITLSDSQIIICTDEQVTLKNVNIKCVKYSTPLHVKEAGAKIKFEGSNTFTGNGAKIDMDIYYRIGRNNTPAGASQGMLIDKGASVTLTGSKATFKGSAGGAGICPVGDLTIDGAEITAKGSSVKYSYPYAVMNSRAHDYVYAIGAGIGASYSYVDDEYADGDTYSSYGKITIKNSTVNAEGVTSEDFSSKDIGGVDYAVFTPNYNYQTDDYVYKVRTLTLSGGSITGSEINTANGDIDLNFKHSNNTYNKVKYKITVSTAGSDGDTDDNLSFNLKKGDTASGWMSSKCGKEKGESSFYGTSAVYLDDIDSIDIKIDGDDGWYPEYVKVTNVVEGTTHTFYGGRWLDDSKTITLKKSDNVFALTIKTSNSDNSGTDAGVYAKLVDADGTTSSEVHLSGIHPQKNAFEKGDEATFYINTSSSFDKVQYAQIRSASNGTAASDWKIESVKVTQVSGKNTNDSFKITVDQWDPNDVTMSFGREMGKSGTFEFDIKTQNVSGAGTDATIYFTIIGSDGSTDEVNVESFIDSYTSGNNFEKNRNDKGRITFKMPTEGIGAIEKLKIRSSGGALSADWDVEYVEITEILPDGQTGQHVKFNVNDTVKKNKFITCTDFSNLVTMVGGATGNGTIDRELLSKLEMVDDQHYILSVDEPVTIPASAMQYIKDNNLCLTIEMKDGDRILYSVDFTGKLFRMPCDITFGKNYTAEEKETIMSFITANSLEGTVIKIYLTELGFEEEDEVAVYVKDEEKEEWIKTEIISAPGEIYCEMEITEELASVNEIKLVATPAETDDVVKSPQTSDPICYVLILLAACAVVICTAAAKKRKAVR